jgi:hypothetical protein
MIQKVRINVQVHRNNHYIFQLILKQLNICNAIDFDLLVFDGLAGFVSM